MKKPKLTPWFDKHVKPVHTGVYIADWQKASLHGTWYAYWDGKKWGWMVNTVDMALSIYQTSKRNRHPQLAWRGLANKP